MFDIMWLLLITSCLKKIKIGVRAIILFDMKPKGFATTYTCFSILSKLRIRETFEKIGKNVKVKYQRGPLFYQICRTIRVKLVLLEEVDISTYVIFLFDIIFTSQPQKDGFLYRQMKMLGSSSIDFLSDRKCHAGF